MFLGDGEVEGCEGPHWWEFSCACSCLKCSWLVLPICSTPVAQWRKLGRSCPCSLGDDWGPGVEGLALQPWRSEWLCMHWWVAGLCFQACALGPGQILNEEMSLLCLFVPQGPAPCPALACAWLQGQCLSQDLLGYLSDTQEAVTCLFRTCFGRFCSFELCNSLRRELPCGFYLFIYLFYFFIFGGVWTQSLMLARQVLLPLELLCQPCFVLSIFETASRELFAQDWLRTLILLISASWAARITDLSHQHLVYPVLLINQTEAMLNNPNC
jgi:hypothetical protein